MGRALRHSGVEVAVLILEWWDIVVVVVLGGWGSAGMITGYTVNAVAFAGCCIVRIVALATWV